MSPAQTNLLLIIQALATEPSKVGARIDGSTMTVTAWKKDHPRLVGTKGDTIYALKKIAEHTGTRLTLTEPEIDLTPVRVPAKFSPRAILDGLHAAAGAHGITTEGTTDMTVRNCQLPPDFIRAVSIVFYKAGKARGEHWEVTYA